MHAVRCGGVPAAQPALPCSRPALARRERAARKPARLWTTSGKEGAGAGQAAAAGRPPIDKEEMARNMQAVSDMTPDQFAARGQQEYTAGRTPTAEQLARTATQLQVGARGGRACWGAWPCRQRGGEGGGGVRWFVALCRKFPHDVACMIRVHPRTCEFAARIGRVNPCGGNSRAHPRCCDLRQLQQNPAVLQNSCSLERVSRSWQDQTAAAARAACPGRCRGTRRCCSRAWT